MDRRYQAVAGALIVVAGLLLLGHPEFRRHVDTRQIEIADQNTTLETSEVFTVPRIVSALIVIFGVALIVAPKAPPRPLNRKSLKGRR